MKKIISYLFVISLFVVLLTTRSYSGQGTSFPYNYNDSLLFDGAEENSDVINISDYSCSFVVNFGHHAWGDVLQRKIMQICGQPDTTWELKKNVELKATDMLAEGSKVMTEYDGEVSILMKTGSSSGDVITEFYLAGNSELELPRLTDLCNALKKKMDPGQITIDFNKGKIFYKINKEVDNILQDWHDLSHDAGLIIVHAYNSVIDHVNTQFSVEVTQVGDDTVDVIKVYEGSAKIKLKTAPPPGKNNTKEQIDQLNEDFKNGKITKEDYQSKLMEITQKLTSSATDMLPQDVEAGNKCTVTKNSLKVEPIESNDDHWWENIGKK